MKLMSLCRMLALAQALACADMILDARAEAAQPQAQSQAQAQGQSQPQAATSPKPVAKTSDAPNAAPDATPDAALDAGVEAIRLWNEGRRERAVEQLSRAIAAKPGQAAWHELRAQMKSDLGDHAGAAADYDAILALPADSWNLRRGRRALTVADIRQARGEARFRAGRIAASIEDFDAFLKAQPARAPHHWQRGIALYYAGRYKEAAEQFESHREVNPHDVENAAWHFLCVARDRGAAAARASLIPTRGDSRVPMAEIQKLFADQAALSDVLAACKAGDLPPPELRERLFYAHLYLGLHHEAHGRAEAALEAIRLAVEEYPSSSYMGDVARVHLALRRPAPTKPEATKPEAAHTTQPPIPG